MFAFVCYRVSQLKVENKIYNPFEILGIKTVRHTYFCVLYTSSYIYSEHTRKRDQIPFQTTLKNIVSDNQPGPSSHFISFMTNSHPDKVKVTANLTIEAIQERFVEITKAYKS